MVLARNAISILARCAKAALSVPVIASLNGCSAAGLQPDIDLVNMRLSTELTLSHAPEMGLPLLWTALLAGRGFLVQRMAS